MIKAETKALLQLTPQESKILECLELCSYNISQLAEATDFPRTTLYTALSSLTSRKLISSHTEGKAKIISLTSKEISANLFPSTKKHNLLNVWTEIVQLKNQRILSIQSTESMKEAVIKFNSGEFIPINNAIKDNNIIIESVVNKNGLSTYMDLYKDNKVMQEKILKSFEGRMADMTFVSNEYLHTKTDLVITHNKAYLMQWKKDVCIEIQEREIIDFLKQLFTLVKGYGEKIDFHTYMKSTGAKL